MKGYKDALKCFYVMECKKFDTMQILWIEACKISIASSRMIKEIIKGI